MKVREWCLIRCTIHLRGKKAQECNRTWQEAILSVRWFHQITNNPEDRWLGPAVFEIINSSLNVIRTMASMKIHLKSHCYYYYYVEYNNNFYFTRALHARNFTEMEESQHPPWEPGKCVQLLMLNQWDKQLAWFSRDMRTSGWWYRLSNSLEKLSVKESS